MAWTWQRDGWPDFTWNRARSQRAEARFLLEAGAFAGMVRHLAAGEGEGLTVDALSDEAMATSEIEGEVLDRDSVRSSIRRALGLGFERRRAGAAERGIAETMVDLHRSFAAPLSEAMLFGWHRMVTAGRRDLRDVGRWRRDPSPMQVVSGPVHAPVVHFEAPPARDVPAEMARFVAWFNRTGLEGDEALPAMTRAGIEPFYFVCIHPFENGNDRVGRAVAEKALAQGLGRPTEIALAATILARRRDYYAALERNNTGVELTDWLDWFSGTVLAAQARATETVVFVLAKTRLLDRVSGLLNARQTKALSRVLREGPAGFRGGLSAGNYATITGASPATATRDLADMVGKGVLVREGERRYARYWVVLR